MPFYTIWILGRFHLDMPILAWFINPMVSKSKMISKIHILMISKNTISSLGVANPNGTND